MEGKTCNECAHYKRTPGNVDVGKCPVSNDVDGSSPACLQFIPKGAQIVWCECGCNGILGHIGG